MTRPCATMNDEALRDLARRAGIAVEWQDYANRPQVVAAESLRRILAALGLPADTRGDLAASRRLLAKRATLADLPPLVTATAGRPTRLDLGANDSLPAKLMPERGPPRDLTLTPARGRLRIPAVAEIGYHRLQIGEREVVVAVAPAQCRTVDDVVPDARLWGLAAQVYALRSPGDAGIGDAAGVAQLAEAAGAQGADAICLSPVACLVHLGPGTLRPLFALEPPVPEPAARCPRAGVRRRPCGRRHAGGRPTGRLRPARSRAPDRLARLRRRKADPAPRPVRRLLPWSRRRGPARRRLRQLPCRGRRPAASARGFRSPACRPRTGA